MVSTDLRNVADWVAGFVIRDEPMPVRTVAALAAALMDLADQLAALDNTPLHINPAPLKKHTIHVR